MPKTGYMEVTGGKVWYEIVGRPKKTPIIMLHGGPGYPHNYLEPFRDLAVDRQVIFYDQLGCGKSDWPEKRHLWTVKALVRGLKELIDGFGFEDYHIFGHSWGPGLAASFALTKPKGLRSMVLASPYLSTKVWEKDAKRLIGTLPQKYREAIAIYQRYKTNKDEFDKANSEFYKRFVFRLKRLPGAAETSHKNMNYELYKYMWGPYEYWVTGTLKGFDLTPKLHEINVPVLLMCGRYDEASPEAVNYFKSLFPNAKMKVFDKGAHFFFWNQRAESIKTVRDFTKDVDNRIGVSL